MKKLICILLVAINLFTSTAKCETTKPKEFYISLPIVIEKDLMTHLIVKIPKSFKPLRTVDETILGSTEFIPVQDQDPYRWSEIITTISYPGKSINKCL